MYIWMPRLSPTSTRCLTVGNKQNRTREDPTNQTLPSRFDWQKLGRHKSIE
jgi:hypothetical protein